LCNAGVRLPWETTERYIRSGHRPAEEFQPSSLHTIVLSEDEGIKAIVGKPKGKDSMEIQSYLFDLSMGWTLAKAKAWFEKHHESEVVREHLSIIFPFKVLEKIVDKPLRVRGIAMIKGMSRNFNVYTPEELQAFAGKLVAAPIYIEHVAAPNAVGKVTKTEWDGRNLWYEAEIYDEETAEKIRKGLIRHVSVGADYETIDVLDGKVPHGLCNAELSLVAVPGIPETSIQILEKLGSSSIREQSFEPIVAGEYVLGFCQDASAFMPEHFSTVWLDRENGILAIVGKLRANPDVSRIQSIFFAKEKMWDENKIRDWLLLHPHYMAPAGVSASLQTSLKERERMSEKTGQLKERIWSHRYINDLPDSSFAYVEEGERDETGRTVPRTKRHLPFMDAQGRIDIPHLRNALARLPQTDLPAEAKAKAKKMLCTAAKKVGLQSEVCGLEECKLAEQGEVEFEVAPEPTVDELVASVEDVVEQINDAIEDLTARIQKLEGYFLKNHKNEGSIVEGFLKNSKSMIPVEDAMRMIQNVLPTPMVERSWSFGPQRLCQELRGIVLKLRERVKEDG